MRQKVVPGGELEVLTPEEAAELVAGLFRETVEERVRAAATISLDANGAGMDEVYSPPVGFEFEARRVSLDLATAGDPGAGVGLSAGSPVTQAGSTAAAPAAFSTIASLGILPKGTYNVTVTVWESGTPDGNLLNAQLAAPGGFTAQLPTISTPQTLTYRITTDGTSFTVVRTGATIGGAGAVYNATVVATPIGEVGVTVEYLRSGTRIEWGQPQYGPNIQIPGVQTWGSEQGPYIRNGEVFEVRAKGLGAGASLDVTVEGILKRPPQDRPTHRAAAHPSRVPGSAPLTPPRPVRAIS